VGYVPGLICLDLAAGKLCEEDGTPGVSEVSDLVDSVERLSGLRQLSVTVRQEWYEAMARALRAATALSRLEVHACGESMWDSDECEQVQFDLGEGHTDQSNTVALEVAKPVLAFANALGALTALTNLQLDGVVCRSESVVAVAAAAGRLPRLRALRLTADLYTHLFGFDKLGAARAALKPLTALTSLDLRHAFAASRSEDAEDAPVPMPLPAIATALARLDMHGSSVEPDSDGDLAAAVAPLTALTFVSLPHDYTSGALVATLAALAAMPRLVHVGGITVLSDMSSVQVAACGVGLASLPALTRLDVVRIAMPHVQPLAEALSRLAALQHLRLPAVESIDQGDAEGGDAARVSRVASSFDWSHSPQSGRRPVCRITG
jgi:hypothetical protein